jgi:hypothetical protein
MEKQMPDFEPQVVLPTTVVANSVTAPPIDKPTQKRMPSPVNRPFSAHSVGAKNFTGSPDGPQQASACLDKRPESSAGGIVAAEPPKPVTEEEIAQIKQIALLWSSNQSGNKKARRDREELALIRKDLSKSLYAFKTLLTRTGRGGKWSQFLRDAKMPLATADRYAKKWEESLSPKGKLLSEELSEPTTASITKLVSRLKPKLARTLTTQQAVAEFLAILSASLTGTSTSA